MDLEYEAAIAAVEEYQQRYGWSVAHSTRC